jgi:hypothetical protein
MNKIILIKTKQFSSEIKIKHFNVEFIKDDVNIISRIIPLYINTRHCINIRHCELQISFSHI